MIRVECKGCGRWKIIDGGDVHSAVDSTGCQCCPLDHHHGEAANAGTPCRPITITVMGPTEEDPGATGRLDVLGLVTDTGQV